MTLLPLTHFVASVHLFFYYEFVFVESWTVSSAV